MSNRHDPALVLRYLADALDIEKTLTAFPGMTRETLSGLLRDASGPGVKDHALKADLFVDGAARGNPGPAGAGVVLKQTNGLIHRFGEYLGEATNNVAEYRALISGIKKAIDLGVKELFVRSDSELIVKQLNGQYKVKSPQLQDLYFTIIKAISSFERVTFTHIPREENKEADRLANMAIDAKGSVSL